jgi:tRNA nucleotidyltransferase/poly(A) polymerase
VALIFRKILVKKYIVGGAVRDRLMGIEPKDIDYVVVGSTPEEMIAAGFKQVGADFPVFLDEAGVEYALARTERKTGAGYNGFTTDHNRKVTLKEDLRRRDLTINAIALDDDGTIIDPYNGADHIANGVLKHVSKAFAEDPVRVLRLARFRARYGAWKIHVSTMKLCKQMVANGELNHLTKERVLKEFEKALSEPCPEMFFKTLDMVGALHIIFPNFCRSNSPYILVRHLLGDAVSVKLKYARLEYVFNKIDAFEEDFRISLEWRRYRKMHDAFLGTYANEVERLYAMDAYRQKDLVEELYHDLCEAGDEPRGMWKAFVATKDIGFGDLTEFQRLTLSGPDIAAAIKTKRQEICNAGR